jgi:hypothetical protein
MKRTTIVLAAAGLILIVVSLLSDYIGFGHRTGIGAAQVLGIEIGILLALAAFAAAYLGKPGISGARDSARAWLARIPTVQPATWVFVTFIVIYVLLFIFPVFFSKPTIQYFNKYVPDAWVTHIGFDMDMTMGRVGRWLATHQSPYADEYYYAPLTLVLFAPLLILGYPAYYKLITAVTLVSYMAIVGVTAAFSGARRNVAVLTLFFATGLFSYGFQFELERGQYNVIAISLALLAIYLFHRYAQYRLFAYILFSLAVQLKIYPVFLAVMFIEDWADWKNNVRRIAGLGVLNFLLLFVLGYQMFIDFVRNLSGVQLYLQSSRYEDVSIKGFVYNLTTDGFGLLPADVVAQLPLYTGWMEGLIFLLVGLCVLSIIAHDFARKVRGFNPHLLAVCTIAMLIVPSASVDYKLPLLIAPVAIVLSEVQIARGGYRTAAVLALIVLASAAYWWTLYPFTVKPYLLSRNFLALFVLMLSITLLYFLQGDRGNSGEPTVQRDPRQPAA